MQFTIAAPHHGQSVGLSNPWTEYVKMLPRDVPVPTMWAEQERVMLVGTSLEVNLWCLILLGHLIGFIFHESWKLQGD